VNTFYSVLDVDFSAWQIRNFRDDWQRLMRLPRTCLILLGVEFQTLKSFPLLEMSRRAAFPLNYAPLSSYLGVRKKSFLKKCDFNFYCFTR